MVFSVLSGQFLFSKSFATLIRRQTAFTIPFIVLISGISGRLQFLGHFKEASCASQGHVRFLGWQPFFCQYFSADISLSNSPPPSNQATFMAACISIPADFVYFRGMQKDAVKNTLPEEQSSRAQPKGQKTCSQWTVIFEGFVAKDFCSRIFLELIHFS